ATDCPICGNTGHLRPHIVWVGEEPLRIATVYEALAQCELFLVIGAPGSNEPTRSFLAAAKRDGARAIEFPGDAASASGDFDECLLGPLSETVPTYAKRLIAGG